ncbi:MAG: NAD-glutamate dehydrogenase, partial [Sulfuritalea sp.]|nr:NAD-glutamate dehydrogenase [Sulfuritalea sp.]
MLDHLEEKKQDILAAVLKLAVARLPQSKHDEARNFITIYYAQIDPEDLLERSVEDLYGAAMAHLSFGRSFSGGAPKLRVYNAQIDEHGWTSPHTVIDIINDDMPFLVDSVTMEVNRQGYTLHLLIHPVFPYQRDAKGRLKSIATAGTGSKSESFMPVVIDRATVPGRL